MTPRASNASDALPSRAQVVIIGGSVIGCSIAHHLAQLGTTDVVLPVRLSLQPPFDPKRERILA